MDSAPSPQSPLRSRTSNACASCRSRKVRCLRVPGEEVCERCHRSGQPCEQPPVRARFAIKRKAAVPEEVVDRLKRLEQGLEDVTSQLPHGPRSRDYQSQREESSDQLSLLALSRPSQATAKLAAPLRQEYNGDIIDRGLLSISYAKALIQEFRDVAASFPYVIIPQGDILDSLRSGSPMLLLAILMAASWRDRTLQATLEHEYSGRLGIQMVGDGEQTLELLQSILVYLGWCHWHMKSAYKFNFFAASIVVNLGLNLNRRLLGAQKQRLSMKDFKRPSSGEQASSVESTDLDWPADAKRAYIGTYVISRSYSLVFRKVDAMKYRDTLEDYALSLASNPIAPLDATLIHYVRLSKHAEDVCQTFGYLDLPPGPNIADDKMQFLIKSFNARIDSLRSSIPASIINDVALKYFHLGFCAFTHEVCLYVLPSAPGTPLTTLQVDLLLRSLESTKSIMEESLSMTDRQMQTLPGYSWARLQYLFHLAMELTLSVDSPSWDPNMVHEVLPIEFYIDQFCERLDRNATLITNSHGSEGNWFQHLATNWRAIRNRYLSELARKGVPVQQAQEPEQMLQGIVTGGDIGADLSVFNGGFAADFWTFDSMPPWGGPVSVGNGNNNMSHIFMPGDKSNAI